MNAIELFAFIRYVELYLKGTFSSPFLNNYNLNIERISIAVFRLKNNYVCVSFYTLFRYTPNLLCLVNLFNLEV